MFMGLYFRRTIKATLLLVPLLGVSNVPLFYEPEHPSSVYMLGSAILQHSQVNLVSEYIIESFENVVESSSVIDL